MPYFLRRYTIIATQAKVREFFIVSSRRKTQTKHVILNGIQWSEGSYGVLIDTSLCSVWQLKEDIGHENNTTGCGTHRRQQYNSRHKGLHSETESLYIAIRIKTTSTRALRSARRNSFSSYISKGVRPKRLSRATVAVRCVVRRRNPSCLQGILRILQKNPKALYRQRLARRQAASWLRRRRRRTW